MERCGVCGRELKTLKFNIGGSEINFPEYCSCSAIEEKPNNARFAKCFGFTRAAATFADDDGLQPEAMKAAKAYVEKFPKAFGLMFFGKCDQGKTFTAECIASELIKKGVNVIFRSVPQIVSFAQREQFSDWIRDFENCDLLIIDDLGAERNTEFAQEVIYQVIDSRYRARKPFIVSTNLTREQLQAPNSQTASRIYGRILETCLPIEFKDVRRRANRKSYDAMRSELGI